jgi:hypothetical protein
MKKYFLIFVFSILLVLLVSCANEQNANRQYGTVDGIITHVYNDHKYKFTNKTVNKSDIGDQIGNLDNGHGPKAYRINGTDPNQKIAVEDNGNYSEMVPIGS